MRVIAAVLAVVLAALAPFAPVRATPEEALKQIIAQGPAPYPDWPAAAGERERMVKLYQDRGYRLLWSDGAKPSAAAIALLQELRRAGERGLDPDDYPGDRLASSSADLAGAHAGPEQWAQFDAGLTFAGMRFMSDLHFGRIDAATVGHNLSVDRVELDVPAALERLAGAVDVAAALDALEPQFRHYALLKKQLARYRGLAGEQGLTDLPPLHAKSVKPGNAYAGAPQLQQLLAALGDAPPQSEPEPAPQAQPQILSASLSDALKRFQRRHGEKADGVLGTATFAELTRPLSARARQIELTMERWRWLPEELTSAPIIVNIPQFRLFAFESTADSEAQIRQMDVIVGKAYQATQTPVFSAAMTYVVFRPYWEVPYSIARKEIVPGARRDPNYLDRHQMEIVRGFGDTGVLPQSADNLAAVAEGTLRIRQRPGPDNSLGLIKFMLPNPYNVYLHSTPAQALFGESRRDFSHGCIRVSDPVGLAQYVLRDSPEWTREKILGAMNDGADSFTVTLKKPIRVFIVYGTALATEIGEVLFFDDIYGHDERLEQALRAQAVQRRPPGRE